MLLASCRVDCVKYMQLSCKSCLHQHVMFYSTNLYDDHGILTLTWIVTLTFDLFNPDIYYNPPDCIAAGRALKQLCLCSVSHHEWQKGADCGPDCALLWSDDSPTHTQHRHATPRLHMHTVPGSFNYVLQFTPHSRLPTAFHLKPTHWSSLHLPTACHHKPTYGSYLRMLHSFYVPSRILTFCHT